MSETSVSRCAAPPHAGQGTSYHSLCRASGETPESSGWKSGITGSSTGRSFSGTGTGPCFYCAYDPGRARELLSDGKIPRSVTITLAFPGATFAEQFVDRVALDIQRTLGLHTDVVSKKPLTDYRAFLAGTSKGLLGALSWTMRYPTPDSFLRPLFGPGGEANFSRWHNPTYDGYMAAAHAERTDADRLAIYRRAEDLLVSQLPIIPLWYEGELRLVNLPRYTGLDMDPFGREAQPGL